MNRLEPVTAQRLPIPWKTYWKVAFAAAAFFAVFDGVRFWALQRPHRQSLLHWMGIAGSTWAALMLTLPGLVFLASRLPIGREKIFRNILIYLAFFPLFHLVLASVSIALQQMLSSGFGPPKLTLLRLLFWVDPTFSITVYTSMAALLHVSFYSRLVTRAARAEAVAEKERARLHESLLEARLRSLKSQLHPHFLFNTLNTISSLVTQDPVAARRVVAALGDLLRTEFRDPEKQFHTVSEEVAFLQRYIDIQKARFQEKLEVDLAVDESSQALLLPSMLLQPLVENAIRYGASDDGVTRVSVNIWRNNGQMRCAVRDHGAGFGEWTGESGVGITNTQERLSAVYGERASLELNDQPEGGAEVLVTVPAAT